MIAKGKKTAFITIEGLEGSGKTSVICFLKEYLEQYGRSVKIFREPGSTLIGEQIRKVLLFQRREACAGCISELVRRNPEEICDLAGR